MMTDEINREERKEKLRGLIKNLKSGKQLSHAKIFLASDEEAKLKTISFGVPELDNLCSGLLMGGYTIFYGSEKSGKSSIMLRSIAQMQQDGLSPVLLDLEERFDPAWAAVQGVDLDNLFVVSGAMDLEEALTIVETGVKDDLFTGVAVDSIAAKSPRGELQDKKGKARGLNEETMALMARLLSKWFRRMSFLTKSKKIPMLLLAQVRTANINAGAYLDVTGGLALKHYASTIVKINRTEKISMTKQGEKVDLGYWIKAELKKTSLCANEGKDTRIPFYFGVGVEDSAAAVRSGINLGVVTNLTRGLEFNGKKYASEPAFVEKLRANDDLKQELLSAVSAASGDTVQDTEVLSHGGSSRETRTDKTNEGKAVPTTSGDDIEHTAALLTCQICGRSDFKSERARKGHMTRMHKDD